MNISNTASERTSGPLGRALRLWRESGKVERICAIVLVMWLLVIVTVPDHFMQWVLRLLLIFFAGWTFLRWFRGTIRQSIWRLRNRLVVAYLFMAAVPVILILLLAMVSSNILANHLAVYLANSELERRIDTLRVGTNSVMRFPAEQRIEPARRLGALLADQYPGFELILDGQAQFVFPPDSAAAPALMTSSPSVARSIANWAWLMVPATSPRINASAVRYSSTAAGRRRNSGLSTTAV